MKKRLGEVDGIFYTLGKVALTAAIAAVLLYVCLGVSILRLPYMCIFYEVTGLYCPGCGGIRSVRALLRGDIWQSFINYPPTLYGVVVYSEFMFHSFYRLHILKDPYKQKDGKILPYIYVGIGLMLVQWIAKLIAQICFNYSWIR